VYYNHNYLCTTTTTTKSTTSGPSHGLSPVTDDADLPTPRSPIRWIRKPLLSVFVFLHTHMYFVASCTEGTAPGNSDQKPDQCRRWHLLVNDLAIKGRSILRWTVRVQLRNQRLFALYRDRLSYFAMDADLDSMGRARQVNCHGLHINRAITGY
jgi:hypothetical protein